MQNTRQLWFLGACTSIVLLGAMCFAQNRPYPQTPPGQTNPMGTPQPGVPGQVGGINDAQMNGQMEDHAFMKQAAEGGMAEVQMGQLAQQNGQSQQVKDFGQRMVTDHSKANDELKQLAQQQGVRLPDSPSGKEKAEYRRLSKLHGDAFDDAYAKLMVKDHKSDIAEFQREADSGYTPAVKNWASQTLPTLKEHLQLAEQMKASENPGSNKPGKSGSGTGSSPQQ
jgi:putative membrane protein